jgi:hypothetical protein
MNEAINVLFARERNEQQISGTMPEKGSVPERIQGAPGVLEDASKSTIRTDFDVPVQGVRRLAHRKPVR